MKTIAHAWVALMALERLKPPKKKGYIIVDPRFETVD